MGDDVLPFSDEAGAAAYFGESVGGHVAEARRALRHAERRLSSLRALYDDPEAMRWHVNMEVAEFLAWARQVRVSIDAAVKAAASTDVSMWWDGLRNDAEFSRFTERRNRALKRVEPASQRRRMAMDIDGARYAVTYFAFADDPYAEEPVFPRCQKHLLRLLALLEYLPTRLPSAGR